MLFYSATIPPSISQIIREYLKPNYVTVDLISNTAQQTALTVKHLGLRISKHAALQILKQICDTYGPGSKTIVGHAQPSETN